MKANLTIDIAIPNYELILARAKVWEKENKFKYKDPADLITDYLMSAVNKGYMITDKTLSDEQNYIIRY